MTDNAKKFLEAASQNEAIRKDLTDMQDAEAFVKIAKAHGFELTAEDFETTKLDELSDDEMQAVAGGATNAITSECTCGKNGTGCTWELECNCSNSVGQGFNTTNGGQRCWCAFIGGYGGA